MTRQALDRLLYEGEDCTILYGPAEFGFDLREYGLFPVGRNTGNHRGYWCVYEIVDGALVLSELFVNNAVHHYPPINGIDVDPPRMEVAEVTYLTDNGFEMRTEERAANGGYHVYRNLGLSLDYTGTATVGRDYKMFPYRNVGYAPPWSFGSVLELKFEDGSLVEARDISATFIEKHKEMIRHEGEWMSDMFDE